MKALICGGRDFSDSQSMFHTLGIIQVHEGCFDEVIHGGAKGADVMAGDWAACFGIPTRIFRADWKTLGKAAGPIRNQQMLDVGKPDLVIAYPTGRLAESRGTFNMVGKAVTARVRLIVVEQGIICSYDGIKLHPFMGLGV